LGAVAEVAGVEYATIDHRKRTRDRSSCRARNRNGARARSSQQVLVRCLRDGGADQSFWSISVENHGAKFSRIILLRPVVELRIRKIDRRAAGRGRRTQGFHREKEIELVMRNNRAADGSGKVVAMKRTVLYRAITGRVVHEFRAGIHVLIAVIVTGQPM